MPVNTTPMTTSLASTWISVGFPSTKTSLQQGRYNVLVPLNTDPTNRQLRQFALVLPLVAVIAAALLSLKLNHYTAALSLLCVTLAASAAGLIHPRLLGPVYVSWMIAAYPIGWLIGHIVIGVIFFLVVTPIGLAMRLVGRDALTRQFEPDRKTYWRQRKTTDDPARYFRQF